MDESQARALLFERIADDGLRKHCLAAGAVLKGLARRLGEDQETWAVAGLVHDLDYPETKDDPARHGLLAAEFLAQRGVAPAIVQAVKAHNAEALGLTRQGRLDVALTCGETITGLVVATTLVYPEKKLAAVKPKSVAKRMKEKAFAASVSREHILLCEELGIPLNDFCALAVESMREVAGELGL